MEHLIYPTDLTRACLRICDVERELSRRTRGVRGAFWSIDFSRLRNSGNDSPEDKWLIRLWPVGAGNQCIEGKGSTLAEAMAMLGTGRDADGQIGDLDTPLDCDGDLPMPVGHDGL